MNLDDLGAAMPDDMASGAQISAALDFLLECDDVPNSDRMMLCNGYLMGLAVALDKYRRDCIMPDVANEILERQRVWTSRNWI